MHRKKAVDKELMGKRPNDSLSYRCKCIVKRLGKKINQDAQSARQSWRQIGVGSLPRAKMTTQPENNR